MAHNPRSVTHTFHKYLRTSPARIAGQNEMSESVVSKFQNLLESGQKADPSVLPHLLEKAVVAMRGGSNPLRMLAEAQERRESFRGSPYTTVGGNFPTWDLVARSLESACFASGDNENGQSSGQVSH